MEAMEKFRPQEPSQHEQRRTQAAENALFRVDVRRSLRLYRGVAIATAAFVFCILAGLIALSKKQYSAECIVSVAPSPQHLMADPNGPTWGSDSLTYDTAIDQQIQLVHRYDVLANAINKPGIRWRDPKETEQAAVNRLMRALTVTRVEKSYQMAISITAPTPAQAVFLADAVAASFLEVSRADAGKSTQEHLAALVTERGQIQSSLDAKIAQQSQLLQKIHVLPGSTAAVDSDYAGLSAAAAEVKVKHDAAEAALHSLEMPGASDAMSNETSTFPTANSLLEKRNSLQAQMAGLTPLNPVYKANQIELAQIEQQIAAGNAKTRSAALLREQSKARTELATQTAQEAALTGRLAEAAAKASKDTPDIEQSNALAAEITRLEVRYGTVDDRIRNMALDNGTTSQLEMTATARAPLQPNPNKRNLLLLLLLPLPLLAGILAAIVALRIDPRIYSAADVEAVTGYPPFAQLLHRKEASPEVMEEYLLRMAAGVESLHTTRGVRTILVTGNSADSGASSIATALALKLQQVNRDSAVLDADADEAAVTQEDIRALSEKHGLLLVDCPPILSSARSEYLARFTDAVLLIAESGRTTRNELRRAMRLLEKVNAGGVAVVLNKVTLAAAEDAVQSEVAEMEQRILDRGTAGYTRPALRLYNTQAPERLFDLSAEESAEAPTAEVTDGGGSRLPEESVAADAPGELHEPAETPEDHPDRVVPVTVVPEEAAAHAGGEEPEHDSGSVAESEPEAQGLPSEMASPEEEVSSAGTFSVSRGPASVTPIRQDIVPAEFLRAPEPRKASFEDADAANRAAVRTDDAPVEVADVNSSPKPSALVESWLRTAAQVPQTQVPSPSIPAEFVRPGTSTLQGIFGASKKLSGTDEAASTHDTVASEQQDAELASATEQPAEAAEAEDEAAAASTITSNADPKPPRHVLQPARDISQAPRNLFRFPWRRAASQSDIAVTDATQDDTIESAEAEFIPPVRPLPGAPAVHETYVPVPSSGWLKGKNNGQPPAQKDQSAAARNSAWMDRAEVERQITGPRRKD